MLCTMCCVRSPLMRPRGGAPRWTTRLRVSGHRSLQRCMAPWLPRCVCSRACLCAGTGYVGVLTQVHDVSAMLRWMASLSIAHPGVVPVLLQRLHHLDWPPAAPAPPAVDRGLVPSSQDEMDLLPSSQETGVDTDALDTPDALVKMLGECVRKTHSVALAVSSPASLAEGDAVWDMGAAARHTLLLSVVRLVRVLAWTLGSEGLHELQPWLQEKGVLLTLLDNHAAPDTLLSTVELLRGLAADPLTLHMALASPFDPALQPRIPARLAQARFAVVDILAKHLVDRRGDATADDVHRLHRAIVMFMSSAARHRDTAVVFAESVPLLPALIQCLWWDTEDVWSGPPGSARTTGYVA